MSPRQFLPDPMPLRGRSPEIAHLRDLLGKAAAGSARSVLLRGEGGVGKTRLVESVAEDARRLDWSLAMGRAFPVGAGAPFASFQDAFVPLLQALEPGALTVLTRGSEAELAQLFPALGPGGRPPTHDGSPSEQKMRLFWNFTELLRGMAARKPLLVILEDLQWADESSLELLHFVIRQIGDSPVQIIGTYNDQYRTEAPGLVATEQSLERMGLIEIIRLQPLTSDDLTDLATEVFGVERGLVREFAGRLHDWTAGNSYFAVETIRALVESGQIARTEGTWVGFDTRAMKLPPTIKEAVVARMAGLSDTARQVARVATVLGTRVPYSVLRATANLPEADLLQGIDALSAQRIIVEGEDGDGVFVDFTHPLVRETLYAELGRARTHALHAQVAVSLESHYGDQADEHADQLAYHFGRSDDAGTSHKVIAYFASAGRHAYGRYAHGASVEHLEAAVSRLDALPPEEQEPLEQSLGPIREDLCWARHAVGRVGEGIAGLERLLHASAGGRRGLILYRLARAEYWAGRHRRSLEHVDEALAMLGEGFDGHGAALLLLRGHCLEQMGQPDDAREAFGSVLETAQAAEDPVLEARAQQAHALLSLWTGQMDEVRPHAERALELSTSAGAPMVEFWSLWVLAAMEGLTGHPLTLVDLEERARRIATEIRAPHLRGWCAELQVEHASATGAWERGITIGEQAVSLAESLGQKALLPRLQVWTGMIHLQRGDFERAKALLDAAWDQAVDGVPAEEIDVHAFVPAHTGRAAYLVATGDYDGAVKAAETGLRVAEDAGYFIWSIHRLRPTLAEALILKRDLAGAREAGARLRKDASRAGHRLGLAWADACEALVEWLSGNVEESIDRLRSAAEALDAVPMIWDAARIRRQLAGRLADMGRTEEATAELREVHDVFSRLGAQAELDKTRTMLREVGARPPARSVAVGAGVGALTAREVEIARMVGERKSNKAIAKELGIAARTVSTHVSNIFKKVDVSSRGELADLVRTSLLPD